MGLIAFLVLMLAGAIVAAFACNQAGPVGMQLFVWSIPTNLPPYAGTLICAGVAALAGGVAGAVLARPAAKPIDWFGWADVMSARRAMAVFATALLLVVLPIAAITGRPALLPMALSLASGACALMLARHTDQLLTQGEKLELRHDIVGIGGGLGGWRLSRAAGVALLTVLVAAGSIGLATAGLRSAEPPAATETGKKPAGQAEAGK